jgi:hypothetical protein
VWLVQPYRATPPTCSLYFTLILTSPYSLAIHAPRLNQKGQQARLPPIRERRQSQDPLPILLQAGARPVPTGARQRRPLRRHDGRSAGQRRAGRFRLHLPRQRGTASESHRPRLLSHTHARTPADPSPSRLLFKSTPSPPSCLLTRSRSKSKSTPIRPWPKIRRTWGQARLQSRMTVGSRLWILTTSSPK